MDVFIEKFMEYLKDKKQASENTIASYNRDLRFFKEFMQQSGIEDINKVNKTTLYAYILTLQKKGKATASITRNIASLRSFFKFLYCEEIVKSDPCFDLSIPKVERKIPATISPKELEQLFNQPKNDLKGIRDRAMMELAYATGLRVSELIQLRTADINVNQRYIRCTTGDKERIIPIGAVCANALERYLEGCRLKMLKSPSEETLFVNRSGSKMTRQGFWKIIKQYAVTAGIATRITPNVLRHSFAMHMIANGADVQYVQEMLGHSDISTTQIYFNLQKNNLREDYDRSHPRSK